MVLSWEPPLGDLLRRHPDHGMARHRLLASLPCPVPCCTTLPRYTTPVHPGYTTATTHTSWHTCRAAPRAREDNSDKDRLWARVLRDILVILAKVVILVILVTVLRGFSEGGLRSSGRRTDKDWIDSGSCGL